MDFSKLSRKDVSTAIGMTVRSINRFVDDGMPRNADGTYCLQKYVQWLLDRAADQNGKAEPSRWLEEWRKHRAAITKIELKRMEGSIILKTDVENMFTQRAFEFSRRLKILSRRVGQEVAGKCEKKYQDVVAVIDAEAFDMMREYARMITIESKHDN
jgi:hypothetical protein